MKILLMCDNLIMNELHRERWTPHGILSLFDDTVSMREPQYFGVHLITGFDVLVGWFHHGMISANIVDIAKKRGLKTIGVTQYYNAGYLKQVGFEEVYKPHELQQILKKYRRQQHTESARRERQTAPPQIDNRPSRSSRQAQPLARLANTEALEQLINIKAGLDRKAQREARRNLGLYFGLLAIIWAALIGGLTYYFGWDVIEPWAYFLGIGVTLGSYAYFAITEREFSPAAIYEQILETKKQKLYQEASFDLEQYERLTQLSPTGAGTREIGSEGAM